MTGVFFTKLFITLRRYSKQSLQGEEQLKKGLFVFAQFSSPFRKYFEYGMFVGRRKGTSGKKELEYIAANTLICEHILKEN